VHISVRAGPPAAASSHAVSCRLSPPALHTLRPSKPSHARAQVLRGSVGIVSTIQRAMLFVSTKAGYVDAELLAAAGKAAAPPDVADGPHCIAPACLQASLERSLRLLRLATVRRRGSRACCKGVPRGMQRRRCPVTHRWTCCTCTTWPRRSWRA